MTFGSVLGMRNIIPAKIEVRFTSDNIGETLSLSDGKTILVVPFEAVQEIIDKERSNRRGKSHI